MTMLEGDLLAALKELMDASSDLTDGRLPSGSDRERFNKAIVWSKRVIERAEKSQ